MPARKQPTPEDAGTVRRILLDGLARDADLSELVSELARFTRGSARELIAQYCR